jgi:uncharacterized protein (TIGR02646 family)
MRHIRKQAEPPALTAYRAGPGARYDGDSGFPPVKDAIRASLVAEQRGLCCYCEQRIQATEGAMRVEHRVPQSVDATRDLDWSNLLGACRGGEGSRALHCDVAKGDACVAIDPTLAPHVATTTFGRDGRLASSRKDFQHDLDVVLCLNITPLVERRQRALDAYLDARIGTRPAPLRRETLARWLDQLDGGHQGQALPPFVSFLRTWLEARLRREAPQRG